MITFPYAKDYYIKITGYSYNSVNVITFGLVQRDHIKRKETFRLNLFLFSLNGTENEDG